MTPLSTLKLRWRAAPLLLLAIGALALLTRPRRLAPPLPWRTDTTTSAADHLYRHHHSGISMRAGGASSQMLAWAPPPPSVDHKPELLHYADHGHVPSAHGSSIVVLPGGGVLAAWFGGSREGARDVAIFSARRQTDGSSWSVPAIVAKVSNEAHWNAVLFWNPPQGAAGESPGMITLHFKVGNSIQHWRTYVVNSLDQGQTWSSPVELVHGDEGGRGCVKNKPLILRNGDILAGASLELGQWRAFVDISTDGGHTWTATPELEVEDAAGVIQPTLWESSNGAVHMLLRSDMGRIYRADSTDAGRSWQRARATELPNNNSGLDVAQLANGVLVLAYNPVEGDWAARYPLRLAISEDDGDTWSAWWDVEANPGEFSYPAIIPWANGEGFCLSYTWNRKMIAFVSMSLTQLRVLCGLRRS